MTNKLKVQYKNVDELIPYANNARTHSDKQITQIAASIKEFGFNDPIGLDGDNGLIEGHGRLLAAKKLGLKQVPTIELSHLSDAQKKAYILAHNKIALNAEWDEEVLAAELEALKELDFDFELTGFDNFGQEGNKEKSIPIKDFESSFVKAELVVSFNEEDRFEIINAITSALSGFNNASIECVGDE